VGAARRAGKHKAKRHEGVHGTARFGGEPELREAGLLPATPGESHEGVYCGAWPDKRGDLDYLMHDGPEHMIAMWPLRSGKLVSLVIPTLTSWRHSAVIYDEKGEIWESTAGWRHAEGGNRVLRWEPGAEDNTVSFNFFSEVRIGTDHEFADVSNIMAMVADPKGAGLESYWDAAAAKTLNGVVLHILYTKRAVGRVGTMTDVLAALDNPDQNATALYKDMARNAHENGQRHQIIAQIGKSMENKDIREMSGIHSTASKMLEVFTDPIVARNTSRSDFKIHDLMNDATPLSLYIVTRGNDKLRLRPLVRLFITMMFNKLLSADMQYVNGQAAPPHRHRLLALFDEFASLRRMETVQESMSKCAGYGIKVFLLCQDREQIINEYGQNENITSMCHIKLGVAPTNYKTAEWWSHLSGQSTVVVEDVSESRQDGSTKKNTSRTFRTVARPLLTPDEVMRVKAPRKGGDGKIKEAGQVMIHVAGQPMFLAEQSLYFLDPEFQRRVAFNAPRMSP
jgi:type IV secretion system protein VirD4